MKFLISNDDGVYAPGLLALYKELSKLGEVVVVAPSSEQSGSASSLHITQPLYTQKLSSGFIAVSGSPADCIYLALHQLYSDIQFDCVITGINSGANLGQDVLYSGTFGAALTAQIFGIPAIATSLVSNSFTGNEQEGHYKIAAQQIAQLLAKTALLTEMKNLPCHVLNVNIPGVDKACDIKGHKITQLGHSLLARPVHQMVDPRGRTAYWLSLKKRQSPYVDDSKSSMTLIENDDNSDIVWTDDQAVAAGYISLSPVRLHHTPVSTLERFSTLKL
ncbi:5'/3'-nucleotidase SurE [uncultured Psychrobacter sp.]|uniref:5'/3'-nucleotidase SurE n=1 Tax=uncultured Psychrobacter sp. TaxID=259303 RepID=UPI00345B136E